MILAKIKLSTIGLALACVMLVFVTICDRRVQCSKKVECQADECQMRDEHFKLYSIVKQAIDEDFNMKGKDIIPFVRTVDVLSRRFAPKDVPSQQLNGTKLILALINDKKLREAIEVFNSDLGRSLVDVYKASINGNQQNLACSQWRVTEIELAARKLREHPNMARFFSNVHKNFVKRSARKCLKSSCSSIDDNMNRLDAIRRHSSRRKGFVAREVISDDNASNSLEELVAQVENEPVGEFRGEEQELCQFFKRTNQTNCQASGNELSEISFTEAVKVNNDKVQSNLEDFLNDYAKNKWTLNDTVVINDESTNKPTSISGGGGVEMSLNQASRFLLTQCRSLIPSLDYHLFGLRWYQKQDLITSHKLRTRTFWCPSLSYWLEIDRLCNELEVKLGDKASSANTASASATSSSNNSENNINSQTFSY